MAAKDRALRSLFMVTLILGASATIDSTDNQVEAANTDFTGLYFVLSPKGAGELFQDITISFMDDIHNAPLNNIKTKPRHLFGVDEWETNLETKDFKLARVKSAKTGNQFQFAEPSGFTLALTNVEADIEFNYNVTAPYVGYPGEATLKFEQLRFDIGVQLPANEIEFQDVHITENPGALAYDISNEVWTDILNMLATDMKSFISKSQLEKLSKELTLKLQEESSKFPKAIPINKKLYLDVDWLSAVSIEDGKFMKMAMKGDFFTEKTHVTPKKALPTPKINTKSTDDFQAYVSDFTLESFFVVTATDAPITMPPTPLIMSKPVTVGAKLFQELFPVVKGKGGWTAAYPSDSSVSLSITNEGCTEATVTISETDYITAKLSVLVSIYVTKPDEKESVKAVTVKVPMELSKLELSASKSTVQFKLNGGFSFPGAFTLEYKASDDVDIDVTTMKTTWQTLATTLLASTIKDYVSKLSHTFKGVTFDQVTYQADFAVLGGTLTDATINVNETKKEEEVLSRRIYGHTELYGDF